MAADHGSGKVFPLSGYSDLTLIAFLPADYSDLIAFLSFGCSDSEPVAFPRADYSELVLAAFPISGCFDLVTAVFLFFDYRDPDKAFLSFADFAGEPVVFPPFDYSAPGLAAVLFVGYHDYEMVCLSDHCFDPVFVVFLLVNSCFQFSCFLAKQFDAVLFR